MARKELAGVEWNFNSIKVQLKLNTTLSYCFDAEFQFHKGTIKTEDVVRYSLVITLFQFHKGTIKTKVFSFSWSKILISIP